MLKILIVFLVLVSSSPASGQVFFAEDFESHASDWTCSSPIPPWDDRGCTQGPDYWKMGPGRNGGNAIYAWRKNDSPDGNHMSQLLEWFYGADIKTEIYNRWYMKVPPAVEWNKTISDGFKFWRYVTRENGYSTPPEIFLNAYGVGDGTFAGSNLIAFFYPGTVLTLTPISDFNDGEWHSHELRIVLNSSSTASDGIIEYWLDGGTDGSPTASHTGLKFGAIDDLAIHRTGLGIGNTTEHQSFYQTVWSAIAFDDYVMSTEYIGPDEAPSISAPSGLRVVGGWSWR